ncbi:GNAT family N-acetyltransferase [Saccharothrix coeruleofusca]|uniref:N-acetyltransferase n=1 Tax=Saccharothrix coeruleofusca TaxID=33919 RepID=A0A918EG17_9PSEU|nr:GNAT family N-acetyltransferase [Saccharothrix coeruleofusca]GGP78418.1 N-acetyltransferase [Saccharothrix coeruleofusca]
MSSDDPSAPPPSGVIRTDRLVLRPWRVEDAAAALEVYGSAEVTRWLSPVMDRVPDLAAMRLLLQRWIAEDGRLTAPAGRWALHRADDDRVIGGAVLLPLPPGDEDLEIGWQLHPGAWGEDYAGECAFALARLAFEHGVDEVFAIVRSDNAQDAAAIRSNGMYWVGETRKYFGLELQVYRLRAADLDRAAPEGHRPPR